MKKKNIMALVAAFCMVFQSVPSGALYAEETDTADFKYGDVNGDGIIDITDLSVLSQHLIKDITLEGKYLKAADTDGDNDVKLGDLAHLKMFVSKYNVTLGPKSDSPLNIKPASDYEEVYRYAEKTSDYYYAEPDSSINAPIAEASTASDSSDLIKNYSDTYNQEENVIEADKVKTDGTAIYSFTQKNLQFDGCGGQISIVYANDGKFEKTQKITIDLSDCAAGKVTGLSTRNMYLYNDMIIVLGTVSVDNSEKDYSFVSAYRKGTVEKEPELINTYYQEGNFSDVRITPDGYLYLITNGGFFSHFHFSDYYINEEDDIRTENISDNGVTAVSTEDMKKMIPEAGTNDGMEAVSPENIYIPSDPDSICSSSYAVIGSINLNTSESFDKTDVKVISGYSGNIYCSADNLYITHKKYNRYCLDSNNSNTSLNDTEITRISLSEGKITPEASGSVPGYVNNQFSMSEYDGYFRIVTTADYRNERSNNVYVLDMDLRKTGEITHFAKDESVKSVSFAGNLGYVVTYVQTDPLFAIDFTDPANPVILDEYKIDGFSTYMQKWDDEHLLGFGVSTFVHENGNDVRDGYKLVMFNNSDPENLSEDGIYKMLYDSMDSLNVMTGVTEDDIYTVTDETDGQSPYGIYFISYAEADRKQLLIAPEKNLIGVPASYNAFWRTEDSGFLKDSGNGYYFFSYDNGKFTMRNFLGDSYTSGNKSVYDRAVYIGDYVYIAGYDKMMAADIDTCTKTDEISLKD